MLSLLLLLGTLQAATLKVETVEGSVLVYVDGSMVGRTPIVLQLDDGRHPMEFKKEEWQVASVRYGLLVDGQTKGKMVLDWATEEVKVVWAEDIVAAREAERARIEREKQAERDALEYQRQLEEDARRAEEQARLEAEQAEARTRYMPHREVGVAAMKDGDRRTALHAFQAAKEAGDTDKRILALVKKLEGEMGSVRLRVTGAKAGVPLSISLDTEEADPFEPSGESRGRYTFDDVPTGVPIELRVSGPGYPSVLVELEPLEPGQRADAAAELKYLGNATLVLTDLPDSIRVTVTDSAAEHAPREAGELEVTAGTLEVLLDGPSGQRTLELRLADGASHSLSVKEQMPGAVILEGLPAGTTVRFVTTPEGVELPAAAPRRAPIDSVQMGVGISDPLKLDSLLPGDYELALFHPVLGGANMRFAPLPGETNTLAFLWETMSQATQVKAARQDWEARLAASKEVPKPTKLGFAAAGGTAAVAAATALMGAQYFGAKSDLGKNENQLDSALADDDGQTAWDLYADQIDLRESMRSTGTISLGGLGLTAAGAGVTVILFGKGKKLKRPVEDWDLYGLGISGGPDLPVPTPSDTSADE